MPSGVVFLVSSLICLLCVAAADVHDGRPGVANCTKHWASQPLDHFGWGKERFNQRYFVYDGFYDAARGGPMLFYTGNEANVELFVGHTGWMWTQGKTLGALLVFAEHRSFGESAMCAGGYDECGDKLSSIQAMADFAMLISNLTSSPEYNENLRGVITIGGSYGGMLAAWMRMWYPGLVNGAVASSAPIAMLSPDFDTSKYWKVVTDDTRPERGSPAGCTEGLSRAMGEARTLIAKSPTSASTVAKALRLCTVPTKSDLEVVSQWMQGAFDLMAMGDYPFPTSYIGGTPEHPMPAYPMRSACNKFVKASSQPGTSLLESLLEAINVVRNTSGTVKCHDVHAKVSKSWLTWEYMVCTENAFHEQPFFSAKGMPNDMFWNQTLFWDATPAMNQFCEQRYGKKPRVGPLNTVLGAEATVLSSNIVLANGLLDPWHAGGIFTNTSRDIVALVIPEGGHHLDLFFPTAQDPPSVVAVRKEQLRLVQKWLS